ncbi:uncharacterized protein LOC126888608 [Diabrotica virgifera virgifera]|uniref:Transposase Helix-turn-helix domain-containing protein n=1 Tax=Diabrotica virgifera virgifera TaxID=50390 RepID=A0ABM5KRV4_DIAVI|nr:uncharacterized protein LOC126888608 [Diabrotica virgifera virgifera]
MHFFPPDKNLQDRWAQELKIGKSVSSAAAGKKKLLKKGVVPSQCLPTGKHERKINEELANARLMRNKTRELLRTQLKREVVLEANPDDVIQITELSAAGTSNAAGKSKDESNMEELDINMEVELKCDKETQADIFQLFPKFTILDHLFTSEKKILTCMGVTVDIFEAIIKSIEIILPHFPGINSSKLRTKVSLTLTKLKLNNTFLSLGLFFGVSRVTASNYFYETIQLMSFALKPAIYFPTIEKNKENMPKCFNSYKSVRFVLDATEVAVQKLNCLKCRVRTYSHYKKTHTVKFVVCTCGFNLLCKCCIWGTSF